jgi:hypothetical protein
MSLMISMTPSTPSYARLSMTLMLVSLIGPLGSESPVCIE